MRSNKYEITRGLWKGWAVPALMYGMEIMEIREGDKKGLEVVQNKIARIGLGANRYARVEALRGKWDGVRIKKG